MVAIKFAGIDSWHRPIFVDENKNYYGCTDKLFDRDDTEEVVLDRVVIDDITFFGRKFGCEPMGTHPGDIRIVKSGALAVGQLTIETCNDCPAYAWRGETLTAGDLGFYCKFGSEINSEYSEAVVVPDTCELKKLKHGKKK
jgi:hypothetical protein